MSRSWEELVAEGRHLVEELTSDKFALGDLIQDAVSLRTGQGRRTDLQPSDDVVPKSSDVSIAEFAEAIGLSYRQAVRYRQTAAAWPNHQRRFDVSFGVYFELASRNDRLDVIRDGMTVDEARQVKGNKPKNELAPKTADEKRETFKELARDPDVIRDEKTVDEIVRDPDTADRLEGALEKHAPRPTPKPEREQTRESAALDLISDLRSIHRTIERVATSVTQGEAIVTPKMADAIVEEVRWLRNALDLIESGVQAGSLDSALTRLIEESS